MQLRSLLSCLFFRKGLSDSKYILSDYLTDTKVMNLFFEDRNLGPSQQI